MSTRATYQIDNMYFYCHYDGYPEGAAQRFLNMVQALTLPDHKTPHCIEDRRGGLAFAFIRGNLDAEPTRSHENHGDTEYRWTLTRSDNGTITVIGHHRQLSTEGPHKWRSTHFVDLADFINLYTNLTGIDRIICAPIGHPVPRIHYATTATARVIANHLLYQATRFEQNNPNRKLYKDRAYQWMDAIELQSNRETQ